MKLLTLIPFVFLLMASQLVFAKGGQAHGFQFSAAIQTADQKNLNDWIDSTRQTGTKNLGSAYEFMFDYQYRFSSSMFAIKFRPSYFTQSAEGGGVNAKLSGYSFFPILRMYPLENAFMKFFLQGGVGYGKLNGKIGNTTTDGTVDFNGDAFGGQAGLGAEFCFTANHCLTIEGNVRYLPMERNLMSAHTGNLGGGIGTPAGSELESDNSDVGTTMSGLQGVLAYSLYF